MRVIYAREVPGVGIVVQVHVDEARKLGDGSPDPGYVREYVYPSKPPEGLTKTKYLTEIRKEVRALATGAAARLRCVEAVQLSFEGLAP